MRPLTLALSHEGRGGLELKRLPLAARDLDRLRQFSTCLGLSLTVLRSFPMQPGLIAVTLAMRQFVERVDKGESTGHDDVSV